MKSETSPNLRMEAAERKLRLKLIVAFDGDVTKAAIAVAFVNGNPEASEEYRRFKEWKMERYRQYCQAKGFAVESPTSPSVPSAQ